MIRTQILLHIVIAIVPTAVMAAFHNEVHAGMPIVREGRAVAEIVIPRDPMPQVALAAAVQDVTRRPAFERRYLRIGWGTDRETFLWSKRQRLGLTELAWMCHGTSHVTRFTQETRPEYLTVVDGRLQDETAFGGPGQSRLAAPLRDAMIRYANAFFNRYPETRHVSVGPNDGYAHMDDRDREAGWLREDRGPRGRLSDYVWTFITEVAEGVARSHPEKIVMGLAYSSYRARFSARTVFSGRRTSTAISTFSIGPPRRSNPIPTTAVALS